MSRQTRSAKSVKQRNTKRSRRKRRHQIIVPYGWFVNPNIDGHTASNTLSNLKRFTSSGSQQVLVNSNTNARIDEAHSSIVNITAPNITSYTLSNPVLEQRSILESTRQKPMIVIPSPSQSVRTMKAIPNSNQRSDVPLIDPSKMPSRSVPTTFQETISMNTYPQRARSVSSIVNNTQGPMQVSIPIGLSMDTLSEKNVRLPSSLPSRQNLSTTPLTKSSSNLLELQSDTKAFIPTIPMEQSSKTPKLSTVSSISRPLPRPITTAAMYQKRISNGITRPRSASADFIHMSDKVFTPSLQRPLPSTLSLNDIREDISDPPSLSSSLSTIYLPDSGYQSLPSSPMDTPLRKSYTLPPIKKRLPDTKAVLPRIYTGKQRRLVPWVP